MMKRFILSILILLLASQGWCQQGAVISGAVLSGVSAKATSCGGVNNGYPFNQYFDGSCTCEATHTGAEAVCGVVANQFPIVAVATHTIVFSTSGIEMTTSSGATDSVYVIPTFTATGSGNAFLNVQMNIVSLGDTTADRNLVYIRKQSPAESLCILYIEATTNYFKVHDGTVSGSESTTATTGAYNIHLEYVKGTGTNGTCRAYNGATLLGQIFASTQQDNADAFILRALKNLDVTYNDPQLKETTFR
jgi:hypothetical protein